MLSRRVRSLRTAWVCRVTWFAGFVALGLPAILLDEVSGLRLHDRPAPCNLLTLTRALAALPAALLAWRLPAWLAVRAQHAS